MTSWKTAITRVSNNKELVRGYNLSELIEKKDFVDVIFLVLTGELPNRQQARMLNALFTAAIDHGVGVSSALTARTVVSTGNSLHTALASGILALGTLHGSAVENAAKFLQEHHTTSDIHGFIKSFKEKGAKIPGYGHKILSHDPRSDALFTVARETSIYGPHCIFAEKVHEALNALSSKKLPLNVDGSMAAILSDMGFDWRIAKGIFIIGRVPGLVAHVYEEMTTGPGLRRLLEDETEYTGRPERSLPE